MRYAADITVQKHDFRADGKSCFDLLALNAHPGDTLQIIARGDDAGEAIDAFKTALATAVE
jgi:phosphotransferase system HPr (HPr) family protein